MLPRFAVNRPVTVLMATLAVSTFGLLAVQNLPVDLLPDLSYPTLTIQTEYEDAAPETVEQFVTRPIEEAVGVIPGVREMRSQSRSSLSEVVLEFEWGESMDTAGLDVRERLGLVELPREAEIPRVLRFDPSLEPIMRLGFHGDRDLDELRQLADRWLKPRLEAVVGVAAARVRGGLDAEIVVEADEDRLAAIGLTPADLAFALRQENVNQPGGTLRDFNAIYLVRTMHEFEDLEQIRRTVVRELPTGRVRVEDVARVYRGHRDRDEISRLGGREVVEIDLHRQGTANTVAVAQAVEERLDELRGEMPPDLDIEILTDLSAYITASIQMVWSAAWIGGLLAVLVLYFFLRDLRATGIIALTIPISVVATFLFMQRAGVSLNIMSLGGLALGIGMLVDNSIVVLEAIDRRRGEGLGRAQAAITGAGEVAGAVTAATLTTVAVFFPIVFVQGVAGQLFRDQAVTVCLSLVTSLVVSLTLIPALSGFTARTGFETATRFGGRRRGEGEPLPFTFRLVGFELEPVGNGRSLWSRVLTVALFPIRLVILLVVLVVGAAWWIFSRAFEFAAAPLGRALDGLSRTYPGALTSALKRRWMVVMVAITLLALSVMIIPRLGTDLVPDLAQGEFAFQLRLPEGTTLEASAQTVDRIEAMLIDDPAFASVFSMVGSLPSAASGRRTLGDILAQINFRMAGETGAEEEAAAVQRVREVLSRFPRAEAELVRPAVLSVRPPIAVQVFSDDLLELDRAAERVRLALENLPEVRDVATTSEPGNPEILVELDRERAAALGVSAEDVGSAMRTKIRGDVVGEFRDGEERIDIRLRAGERFRSQASGVQALRIILPNGTTVPVSAVAEVVTGRGPAAIYRYSGARVAEITALPTTRDLGGALTAVNAAVADLDLPRGAHLELAGQNEELAVSFNSLWLAMALATFLVYVVMASQFESLVHPFVILMAVPLGVVGVIVALVLTAQSISVLVLIGAIMLAGIVVNNAIVLVDAVNRRRREGQSIDEALLGAGSERLRPILMTTATTVLALFPMALGLGAGDELRAPLAITVIGGLTVATFLTLLVIPCIYRILGAAPVRVRVGESEGDTSGSGAGSEVEAA
jgi:HAE1 family hydrophobic/amphiphilic exporter-1